MYRIFDALSYWITVYSRERGRTFANVHEEYGIRRLSDSEVDGFRARLRQIAHDVLTCFSLSCNDLYEFLRRLIGLYEGYRKDERYTLSSEIKSDILHLSNLIELSTGVSREQVEDALSHYSYYDARTFRHLDEVNKERDYAVSVMKRVAGKCAADLRELGADWSFAESEITDLLDYCEEEGLGLLPTALSGMTAIGDEEYQLKFRRVTRYSNLKNMLCSYEYLLKNLGANAGISSGRLTTLVRIAMQQESWLPLFNCRSGSNVNLLYSRNTSEFVQKPCSHTE